MQWGYCGSTYLMVLRHLLFVVLSYAPTATHITSNLLLLNAADAGLRLVRLLLDLLQVVRVSPILRLHLLTVVFDVQENSILFLVALS